LSSKTFINGGAIVYLALVAKKSGNAPSAISVVIHGCRFLNVSS
jgi:hypothetical protein